jgi:hypothetical protein
MLEEAVRRAQGQARIDGGVDPQEWSDAGDSGRIVTVAHALGRATEVDGHRVASRLRITTAAATDSGLVVHATTWDASRGPDPREGGFTAGEAQLIPWRSVASIRRTATTLSVETVTGTTVSVDLTTATHADAESLDDGEGELMTPPETIARTVNLFVEAAQRKVATAR